MSRWILSVAMALVGVLASPFWVSAASAQTFSHAAYIDLDDNPGTGCSTTTAAGVVSGIEARITATVSGQPPMVTAVTREMCAGAAFGAPLAQPAGYPVGLNNGIGGADVVEWSTSLTSLGSGGPARIVFVSSSASGADAVVANGVFLPGTTTGPSQLAIIPATGVLALLLLVGLVLWIARRHPGFGSSVALLLLLGAGLVWAANFITDGQVGDWVGVSPRVSDATNDQTSSESNIDLVAAFAETEAGSLFLRVDVRDAQTQAPSITSANNTTLTVGIAGTFTVNSTGVPTAALSISCTPALPPSVTFTDNGNGTATLAGTPATGTANTYNCTITANNGIAPNATQAFTLTIARANTTTVLVAAPNPSALGQTVTLTATVTTPSTLTPAGTVSFMDGATLLGTATLNGSGVATLTTNALTPGTHPLSAVYAGNVDFNGSTSNTVNQVVDPAPTTTTLSAAPDPSTFGQTVTLTATVNESAPGTPTGTVTFMDGATTLGTATLVGGVATLNTNALGSGSHNLTAIYAGDANFAGSTSNVDVQVVNQAATTTTLVSSDNPSVFGQAVTFTATVSITAPGAGTPTGTVTFLEGVTPLGTVTLSGGQASFTTSTLALGTHPIVANFNGTIDLAPSNSATLNQVVNQAATTTALTSNSNPSIVGESVTFTATVTATAPGGGTPTGTVTFVDNVTTLATVPLNGSGVATFTTNALSVGTHPITASYNGSVNFATSTSPPLNQVVTLSGSSTALTSSVNPTVFGQLTTFTATVTAVPPAVGTPTGSVTFTEGALVLATVPLDGSGVATFSTSTLAVGTHPITATYNGDATFGPSTSAPVSQAVNLGATTTTLASDINPSAVGQSVTFTATVSVNAPAAGTPTGTVTFFDGATNLGTNALVAGQATLSVTSLAVGGHSITATFNGDANFATSTSGPLTQTVAAAATTTTLGSAPNPSAFGETVTFTATVSPVAPGAGTPTGAVTFFDGATNLGSDTLDGSGVATLTLATLAIGTHPITANYATDGNYLSSSSNTVNQVVSTAATTTTLTSSLNPSAIGQSVTFTATVTSTGIPTGTVTFFDGVVNIGTDTLDGAGVATLTTNALSGGTHSITAVYAGDSNYAGSTSNVVSQNVDAPPAVTTVTPVNGATQVPTNSTLTINFDENVSIASGGVTLDCGGAVALTGLPANNVNTVTLTPSTPLPAGALCTATVLAAGVTDFDAIDPPDNMAADFVWSFTADAAPAVTATTPTSGAVDQANSTNLTVTFSEPVNASGASFTLSCATSGPHTFALSGGPTTYTLNPDTDFTAGETCTATVLAAGVTDLDAVDPPDNMAANFVFSFTVDAAPNVTSTLPTNGATQVASNTAITINFNESVNATAASFVLECPSGTPIAYTLSASPSASFTLTPSASLPFGTTCTVTVVANQVTDVDANDPPDNLVANFVFSFTTDQAPSVTTTTPANGATGVAPNATITVNFSESVNATTSSFTIQCPAATANRGYTLSASPAASFTLTPSTNLPTGTICTVTVIAAQITDADAGDPPDNMFADFVFSFSVPPVAANDTYAPSIVGNVGIDTSNSTNFSVITNDTPNTGISVALVAGSISPAGGLVTLDPDGTFAFTPPAGYEGAASFQYNITNAAGTSNNATVNLDIVGMIWFIDNAAAAGNGRLATPFNSLATFQAINNGTGNNPAAGDSIFLYEDAAAYVGPVTLLANQRLIGQDATASLAAISGVTVPLDSLALPGMATGAPATTIAAASSDAVRITNASSNTIRGLTLGNVGGTGTALNMNAGATTFGTLTINDLSISTDGRALNLQGGTLAATIATVSSNGASTQGIALNTVSGSLTISGATTITNPTGIGIDVQSGFATLSFAGTTVNKGATAGTGVNLTSNNGATTFSTLAITTSNGSGLVGTNNPGAINVTTAAGSSIAATGGAALDITNPAVNRPINLNFTTLATTNSPVNAVNLDRVGGAGLTVTGATTLDMAAGSANVVDLTNLTTTTVAISTASTVGINDRRSTGIFLDVVGGTVGFGTTTIANPNAAGGYGIRVEDSSSAVTFVSATISDANVVTAQNDADSNGIPDSDGDGDAIFLTNNTGSFAFNGGALSNCGNDCIDARGVSALALSGVSISLPGVDVVGGASGFGGHGISAINLTGTSSITGSTVSGFNAASRDGLYLTNTVSTPLILTVHGSTFQNSTGNRGIGVSGGGAANMTVTIGGPTNNPATNCTFSNISGVAVQSVSGAGTGSTSVVNITVQNSTFQNSPVDGKTNLLASVVEAAQHNVVFRNNTFNNVFFTASTGEPLIGAGSDGTLAGNQASILIQNNNINNIGNALSNCAGGAVRCRGPFMAISVFIDDAANVPGTVIIDNNTITNVQQGGINLDMANTGASSSAIAGRITNNCIGRLRSGGACTGAVAPVGLDATGSSLSGIRVERRRNNSLNGNVLVSGNTVRNGTAVAASALNAPGIFARTKANSNLSVTVTGNDVDTIFTGVAEMRLDTNANDSGDIVAPTQCDDISGNTFPAGAAAIIDINEINGTHNVEQASGPAITTANGGSVTVTPDAGVTFGVTCAVPPP